MKLFKITKEMCKHASSAELGCFIGFAGMFVFGICYLCYALIKNIIVVWPS